jgi:putative tricarboxylic transport membrane protein
MTESVFRLGRRGLVAAAAGIALTVGLAAQPAPAQDGTLPDNVHFLVPGGAGGGWDGTARGVGEALTEAGIIDSASFENMSGGGGGVAIAHMIETADQQADTLMVNSTPIVIRSLTGVFPQSFRDLTPIASVIADYGAFVVPADSPIENWEQVVEAYREDPSTIKFAGGSVRGGMDHLVAALAFQAADEDPLEVAYIAYDAGGEALSGLLSGETQVLSTGLGEALSQQNAGTVRILATTADERIPEAPDVPTLQELGYNVSFANWRGFFGAPGLSDERADAYAQMLEEMYDTEAWEEVRQRNGWVNLYQPRAEFVEFLEQQEEEVGAMMRRLGVL